jgi:hypothetical protein
MGAAPSIREDAAGSNGQRGSSEQGCLQEWGLNLSGQTNISGLNYSRSCSNHQFTTSYCVQGVISSVLLHNTLTELQLGCIIGAQLAEL